MGRSPGYLFHVLHRLQLECIAGYTKGVTGSFFDFRKQMADESKPARRARAPRKPSASADQEDASILSVSQLTAQIDQAFKSAFPASLLVKGEVSNFKLHSASGHAYFTLKDATSCVDCVMWRSDVVKLKFSPQDGMELLVSGRLRIYAQRGSYQLYASRMQPLGQGALEIAFAQLKAKLEAEGLFEAQRKRPIPPYPLRIALFTGASTAALEDMLKTLRRYSFLRLFLYPVPVQGEGAAQKIAAAIAHLSATHKRIGGIDVALLARGGGSLEDLWAFNEEPVARAIATSAIPIVTGIGHEVDVSIADLVADYHAHTPTEAATVITTGWKTARDGIDMLRVRARQALRSTIESHRKWLGGIERLELFRRPGDVLNSYRQRVDERQRDLEIAIRQRLEQRWRRISDLTLRLERNRPSALLARQREALQSMQQRLLGASQRRLRQLSARVDRLFMRLRDRHPRHRAAVAAQGMTTLDQRLAAAVSANLARSDAYIQALSRQLNAVGPQQVLARGYSITLLKKDSRLVRSAADVRPGDRLVTRLADGESIESTADDLRQPKLFE